MKKAKMILDRDFAIGRIDPRIYGSFIEHLGRAVYGGIYEPGHPTADKTGFRRDVIEKVRELGIPVVRYPGGNFVSGFNWEDSIGPRDQRPKRLDLAWGTTETNEVGLHEFAEWAKKANTEVMYAVNLGTRGADAARNVVEYCNHRSGSYWSDLRIKNGAKNPFNIKLWCLGNEMDGPWQMGQKTAYEYGRAANEAAKMMKWVDPSIELVACGSCAHDMPTYGSWEYEVLDQCYDVVDYLSVHHYHSAPPGNLRALLGGSLYYEDFINTEVAMCDFVASKHRSPKKMMISFDEFGGMIRPNQELNPGWGRYNMARIHYRVDPERKYILHDPDNMKEHVFPGGDMEHMLSMTSIQLAFLRHADRVKIGCMTGGLFALCASNHDRVWRTASHYAYMQLLKFARGISMQVSVDSETYDMPGYAIDDTSQYTGKNGVNFVDCAAAWDKESGNLSIFVINRNESETYPLDLDLRGFTSTGAVKHMEIASADISAVTSPDNDSQFAPVDRTGVSLNEGILTTEIRPLSWNVIVVPVE